jgi:hypothetical protein
MVARQMQNYRVDLEYIPPEEDQRQLLKCACPVTVATLDLVASYIRNLDRRHYWPEGVPEEHLRITIFQQDREISQGQLERWVSLEDPSNYKLIVQGKGRFNTAFICYNSSWAFRSALLTCDVCPTVGYPDNPPSTGGSYHTAQCSRRRGGISACTLHFGPLILRDLLDYAQTRGEHGRDFTAGAYGGLTVRLLEELFPELLAGLRG